MTGGESIRVVHPLFQEEGGGSIPTSPLQLNIGFISVSEAVKLNSLWHSRLPEFTSPQGYCKAFGAEYDGLFYAVAIWSPPLARMLNHTGRFELRRLAISNDAPKNTPSRMLKIMRLLLKKELPDVNILISYQDTGVHDGTIYKAAGWKAANVNSVGGEWARPNRDGRKSQAVTPKIRWEYEM